MSDTSLEIFISLLMVRFVASEAVYRKAKWTKTGLHFPVGIVLRTMFRFGGPFLVFVAYKVMEEDVTRAGKVFPIIIALMGVGCILVEPGEIIACPEGIKYKKYLGLQTKLIPWERAAARCVRSSEGIQEILLIGRNGVSFSHSQYHVGQERFLMELQRRNVFIQGYPAKHFK
jgi:hypothetical protein